MEEKVLDLKGDFEKLREILRLNELWYGDMSKIIVSNDIKLNDEHDNKWMTVMVSFIRPEDKQLFLNIIVHGLEDSENTRGEYFDNYFFTWYDNRPFEIATLNGNPITEESYKNLLRILEIANLNIEKGDDRNISGPIFCECHSITKKNI